MTYLANLSLFMHLCANNYTMSSPSISLCVTHDVKENCERKWRRKILGVRSLQKGDFVLSCFPCCLFTVLFDGISERGTTHYLGL